MNDSYAARVLARSREAMPVARSGGAPATVGEFSLAMAVAAQNTLLQILMVTITNPNAAAVRVNLHAGYFSGFQPGTAFTQTSRANFVPLARRRGENEVDRPSEVYSGTRAAPAPGLVICGVDVPPSDTRILTFPGDGIELIGSSEAGRGALIVATSAITGLNRELVCAFFGKESPLPQSFE